MRQPTKEEPVSELLETQFPVPCRNLTRSVMHRMSSWNFNRNCRLPLPRFVSIAGGPEWTLREPVQEPDTFRHASDEFLELQPELRASTLSSRTCQRLERIMWQDGFGHSIQDSCLTTKLDFLEEISFRAATTRPVAIRLPSALIVVPGPPLCPGKMMMTKPFQPLLANSVGKKMDLLANHALIHRLQGGPPLPGSRDGPLLPPTYPR